MDLLSLTLSSYLLAQGNQCSNIFIGNKYFNACVLEEPECYPAYTLPSPSMFAESRGLKLVDQQPILFTETGREAILNVFLSDTDIEYWVFFLDTQEVCLMMSGFEVT